MTRDEKSGAGAQGDLWPGFLANTSPTLATPRGHPAQQLSPSFVVACQSKASVPEHLVLCFQGFESSKATEVQLSQRLNPGAWR